MEKKKILIISIVVVVAIGILISNMIVSKHTKVLLETNEGDIVLELYTGEMPITAGNFIKLVKDGFYDGVVFHRVISGFMIQSGDQTGTGRGGPGYTIKDEFTGTKLDRNDRGTVSMANTGQPDSGGSQFFINVADNNFLDGKHPVFGKVIEGLEIVDKISRVEIDENDKPIEEVMISKAKVI